MVRIRGIDAARGIALIGMFATHLDHTPLSMSNPGSWIHVAGGRAAVLFVVVAGFSLALATGGATPHSGDRLAGDRLAILVRSVVLFALGGMLRALGTPVAVILEFYAVYFVIALLLLRLRVRTLWVIGATFLILGPILVAGGPLWLPTYTVTPIGSVLFAGSYPAVVWLGFLILGLALGRTEWTVRRMWSLGGVGFVLAAAGHLGARFVQPFAAALSDPADPTAVRSILAAPLAANLRSTSPFIAVAVFGAALLVIAACLLLERLPWHVLYPLESVGRMALTLYVAHILVLAIVHQAGPVGTVPALFLPVTIASLVVASLWFLRMRRGPLEAGLHALTVRARGRRSVLVDAA
ncbi:DUF418 domain-containing protein [Microbacteriaceae bacterium VKM Ac-2854]|nr:DUF418 domain-containing protein [Microbacteriaceae bacterium VKM Ac-2854]